MLHQQDFTHASADWREILRRNTLKTRGIIGTFILTYLCLGVLVDVFILSSYYPSVPLSTLIYVLLTFQVTPFATLILLAIVGVSLWVTYTFYDRIMLLGTEYAEISPETARSFQEKQLYNVVEEMKVAAGLQYMPKVFIIDAAYLNAFASGYSEKSAMIAVTRGLLNQLERSELQAVIAHELSHIRHQDIKVTLSVGVLSNLMLIVVDILFYSVLLRRRDERNDNRLVLVIVVLRYLLPLITVLLTLFLSRTREFMADAGAVELMRDNEPMARALLKINQAHEQHADEYEYEYAKTPHEEVRQASYLYDPSSLDPVKSLNSLFSTHPSLKQRLEALGFKRKNRTKPEV